MRAHVAGTGLTSGNREASTGAVGITLVFVAPMDGSGATRIFAVPMGANQDVEEAVFPANSARLFVRGDLVTNNDNIVASTTDFTTPDQSATTATLQGVVADGDVNGLVAAP